MNYKRVYESIIARAKDRVIEGYKERHHIVPRCMGGCDDIENLVDLTPEEHYVCHQLLVKMHPDNIKLLYAIQAMSMSGSVNMRTNKMYAWLKFKFNAARRTGKYNICKNCKESFYTRACRPDKSFCSRKCFVENKSTLLKCKCCGVMFTRAKSLDTSKDKYCSVKCKVDFKSFLFNCYTCNKEVRVPSCRLKQGTPKYCSVECRGNGR